MHVISNVIKAGVKLVPVEDEYFLTLGLEG